MTINTKDKMFSQNTASNYNPSVDFASEFAGTQCKIVNYNPNTHTLDLVRASDGKPLIEGIKLTAGTKQARPYEAQTTKSLKTLSAPDAPILEVADNQASIRGSSNNGFYSLRSGGSVIKGPLSVEASPSQVKLSGVTNLNPLLTSCFPSTIVTPIPVAQWNIPGAASLQTISKDVMLIGALIGALTGVM